MSFVALFSFFLFSDFSLCFIRLIQLNSSKSSKRNTLQENEKKTPNTLSIFTIMKIDGKANAFISSIFLSCLYVSSALFCRSFSYTFSASKLMTRFQPIYSQFFFITLTPPFWQNERPIKNSLADLFIHIITYLQSFVFHFYGHNLRFGYQFDRPTQRQN